MNEATGKYEQGIIKRKEGNQRLGKRVASGGVDHSTYPHARSGGGVRKVMVDDFATPELRCGGGGGLALRSVFSLCFVSLFCCFIRCFDGTFA